MAELRDGDYIKGLIRYAERNFSRGYTVDQIRLTLIQQGYSRAAVDRAIKMVEARLPKPMPIVIKEKPKIEFAQEPEKKPGFFSRLFGVGKKKKNDDLVSVDLSTGNFR